MEKAYCTDEKCETEVRTWRVEGLRCPVCSRVMSRLQRKPIVQISLPSEMSACSDRSTAVIELIKRDLERTRESMHQTQGVIANFSDDLKREERSLSHLSKRRTELEAFLSSYEHPPVK